LLGAKLRTISYVPKIEALPAGYGYAGEFSVRNLRECEPMRAGLNWFSSLVMLPLTILAVSGFQANGDGQSGTASATTTSSSAILAESVTPSTAAAPAAATPSAKFDMNQAAARYVALVKEADRISTLNPMSTEAIQSALRLTSRVSGQGITEGVGAYVALTAASHSEFASSLATVVNLLGRDAVLQRLKENPQALFSMINGYGSASKLASGALTTSVASLTRAENVLGQAAYDVQKEPWAKREVDTVATLEMVRREAATPTGLEELTAWTMPPQIADDAINPRFLLAASYRLLGDDVAATELLSKPSGRMCMNRVQLNVRQCLAASQYPYEHLFCLSKHSFGETLGCVKDAVK
jgi:hypothetical protein